MESTSANGIFSLIILLFFPPKKGFSYELKLTSVPDIEPHNFSCPGTVMFVCEGNLTFTSLKWILNDTFEEYALPSYNTMTPPIPIPGIQTMVTSLRPQLGHLIDITTTLRGNASVLKDVSVQCMARESRSRILTIRHVGAPSDSSSATCSLINTTGGPQVSIQWSPSFNSQYDVEMYHVVVNPEPVNPCPTSQSMTTEEYHCSGLTLGTLYSFSVIPINCRNQKGKNDTFTVHPQVPEPPEDIVLIFIHDKNIPLYQLGVQWMLNENISFSERCSYEYHFSYRVVLMENSTGNVISTKTVGSENCSDNLCSTVFPISPPFQSYIVTIRVSNPFASSSSITRAVSVPSYTFSISFENCGIRILCLAPSQGYCSIRYGHNSSYLDTGAQFSTRLNNPLRISVLEASTVFYYRATIFVSSSFHIQIRGAFVTERVAPPVSASSICSLSRTTGGTEVSIRWSSSFTSQYDVERYRVLVNPTPSCSSLQSLSPRDNYICSGLALGTRYSFEVRAVKCGNQEGMPDSFAIQPQAPEIPDIAALNIYVHGQNGPENQLKVQWKKPSMYNMSERCSLEHFNYMLVLEDSRKRMLDQKIVGTDNCIDNLCSSTLLYPPNNNYSLIFGVSNVFGSSRNITSQFVSLVPPSDDSSLSIENCAVFILCSFPHSITGAEECVIEYTLDFSYKDLGPPRFTPLNSFFIFHATKANTPYFYQINISAASNYIIFRGNFTANGVRIQASHQGLLAVGLILLCAAILLCVILFVIIHQTGKVDPERKSEIIVIRTFLMFLVIGCISTTIMLWLIMAFIVGIHHDTCDPAWQSARDGLIISAHILSDLSFLVFGITLLLFTGLYCKVVYFDKTSKVPQDFIMTRYLNSETV